MVKIINEQSENDRLRAVNELAIKVAVSASALMSRVDRANELHAVFTITDSFEYRDLRQKLEDLYHAKATNQEAGR